jgi:hypothetical protein
MQDILGGKLIVIMPSSKKEANSKCNQTFTFEDIGPFCNNFRGPSNNLHVRSAEKDYFSLFIDMTLLQGVTVETSKFSVFSKNNFLRHDLNWLEPSAGIVETYIGILMYMGIGDLPT